MSFKLGVDGGGTKTEGILVDARGEVLARHLGPGCNPNVAGPEQARLILTDVLCELRDKAKREFGAAGIAASHLYMSGNRGFWRETAAALTDFGRITVADDSHPVLELATNGAPGLVLHAGTGSFVAARGLDGTVHYAGGTGWRFGDAGSGYELGRRTISRALLEIQGWMPATRLSTLVRDHTQLGDATDPTTVTRYFYQHAEPNRVIAGLAPAVFRLASEGDQTALSLVVESASELLDLATHVATKLFPDTPLDAIPAGLSGAVLTHALVLNALSARTPLPLTPITAAPIEGVRRLVARDSA